MRLPPKSLLLHFVFTWYTRASFLLLGSVFNLGLYDSPVTFAGTWFLFFHRSFPYNNEETIIVLQTFGGFICILCSSELCEWYQASSETDILVIYYLNIYYKNKRHVRDRYNEKHHRSIVFVIGCDT